VNGLTTAISAGWCDSSRTGSNLATGRRPTPESVLWRIHRSTGVVIALESGAVAQPLPAGVWIRPAQELPTVAVYRNRLHSSPTDRQHSPGGYRVVIGQPDCPPVRLGTVAEYCDIIPDSVWPGVRFFQFGSISGAVEPHDGGDAFRQALADLLDRPGPAAARVPVQHGSAVPGQIRNGPIR
jgi:hypothetical protein